MANILEYIQWRKDITFKERKLNQLDALAFSRVSYFPLEELNEIHYPITIKEIYELVKDRDVSFHRDEDYRLLMLMAESSRYGELQIERFESVLDTEKIIQYAALTILLPNRDKFVSFRGTDKTFIGWREDFNMLFMDQIPAQKLALDYVNTTRVALFKSLYIAGHSKGGNLAVYSSIFASPKIKKKINDVYCFDGPGFMEDVVNSFEYKDIIERVKTYMPQTAIIGKLLNIATDYKVVLSNEKDMSQHNVYTWQVMHTDFVCLEEVDQDSLQMDKVLKDWLKGLSLEDRKRMVEVVFEVIDKAEITDTNELRDDWYNSMTSIYSQYKKLDEEDKKLLDDITDVLFKKASGEFFKFPSLTKKVK